MTFQSLNKIFEYKMLYKYRGTNVRRTEVLIKDTKMFVLIPGLVLASLLAPGTTQEFNGYFNAAAGGNSDDSCSRIFCHKSCMLSKNVKHTIPA